MSRYRIGQSTLEYAVLIVIIIAALLGVNIYMKRGLQGKMRATTDEIGSQYAPGNVKAEWHLQTDGAHKETSKTDGSSKTDWTSDETQTKYGKETIKGDDTFWKP